MADLGLRSGGLRFTVRGDALVVTRNGARQAAFRVAPAIDGEATRLGAWSRRSVGHLAASVQGRDLSVHLALDQGTVCFWVETGIAQFDRLDYLTDGEIGGDGWQTFVSDVFDRFHDLDVDVEVPISSCFNGLTPDRADGAGMTDPGDHPPTWIWNIPIRAFALHTGHGWLGLSLPGPLAVGVTRLTMRDRAFTLRFEHLRATCRGGTMPHLYFLPNLEGPYDTLEAHRDLSARLGWMVERTAEHPAWWAYPTFKPAVDVFATGQKGVLAKDEKGAWISVFTTDTFRSWVDGFLRQSRLERGARVLLDQIFMYGYGSRRILRELGGAEGLRRLIDELQARDVRVGLYFHPYFVGSEESFAVEHPECFCHPKDPSVAIQWCDMDTLAPAYVDWTHPLARQRQMEYLEFLLSDGPGCLNADWLALNNAEGPDPRRYEFHDPDWAVGDLLQYHVHRMVHDAAKRIKPDCLVRRIAAGDCYLQPFIDQIELMEHWMSGTAEWYQRGQIITRASRHVLLGTDPYFLTQTKGLEYWMAMMAWNIPEYGGLEKAYHPYGYLRELPEKDRRRRTAGIQVYLNAPMNRTDECRVSWADGRMTEAWRKRTFGPLKGFYAGLALGPHCVVTYSERCARIGASENRLARLPLPPKALVEMAVRVLHAGGEQTVPFDLEGTAAAPVLRLRVADCGFETLYTEIRYRLPRAGSAS